MNKSGITTQSAITPKGILFSVENQQSVGIRVTNTGISADTNGKKIIKAGTPLTGSLEARGTAFTVAATSGSSGSETNNAVCVALHEVDVTDGAQNANALIWGFVNWDRLDSSVQTLLDTHAKKALDGKITFLKD